MAGDVVDDVVGRKGLKVRVRSVGWPFYLRSLCEVAWSTFCVRLRFLATAVDGDDDGRRGSMRLARGKFKSIFKRPINV